MPSELELRVLHVDDNIYDLQHVKQALEKEAVGCRFFVESVQNEAQYLEALQRHAADIVILDIHLAEVEQGEGLTLVQKSRSLCPDVVVMMRSNSDDASTIAKALGRGADDFISKRSDKGELCLRVLNSYKLAQLKSGRSKAARSDLSTRKNQGKYAGETMTALAVRIPNIVSSAIRAVHIHGETGTGKEVVADLFADHLPSDLPFIKVNCGAITPTLLESELFGHAKGAFTGASNDKVGLLQRASGGWVFLDEVSSLSTSAQTALLRVIENQEVLRVGDTTTRKIDVRVLSACNDDLGAMVAEGKFRQDLWQRLREKEIALPPLRKRRQEIPQLVHHFCKTMDGGPYEVSASVVEVLSAATWKDGNIRELRNCLRAMTEYDANKVLTPLAIPARIWEELDGAVEIGKAEASLEASSGALRTVTVEWMGGNVESFDTLTDRLLLVLVREISARSPKLSMRTLSRELGFPRTTLSERLKRIVNHGLASAEELSELIGSYKQ